jgi:hypothetical protein
MGRLCIVLQGVSQTANRIDKPDIQEAEGADIWVKSSSLQWVRLDY